MKNIFKKLIKNKLKLFSATCSALMVLQATCTPAQAEWNNLMRLLESNRATVARVRDLVEYDKNYVRGSFGGQNVLDYALYKSNPNTKERARIAQYLIENGAPTYCTYGRHLDPYLWGCKYDQSWFSSWLLENTDFDIDTTYDGGYTLAHKAARRGALDALKTINRKRPELLDRSDDYGYTPLFYAADSGEYEVVKYLIEEAHVNPGGTGYRSPFSAAIQNKDDAIIKLILCHTKQSPSATPGLGDIIKGIKEGDEFPLRKALAMSDFDVNVVCNERGDTLLHFATRCGDTRMMGELCDNGANLEAKNKEGKTPLQLAVEKNWTKCVNLLIDEGADPHVVSDDGKGLLDIHSSEEIRKILKEKGVQHQKGLLHRAMLKIERHLL